MDYRLALMCGIDLPIPEIPLIVHQPKVKEIALIGEKEFFIGAQCLCINKNSLASQDKNVLDTTTNFQIFMMVMTQKENVEKKICTQQLLSLLFPNSKAIFTPRSLIIQYEDNTTQTLDENNFEFFQSVARQIFCFDTNKNGQDTYNPANKKAQEIANKLMKGRQKVAELKGVTDSSILSQYMSTLVVGLHSMALEDCMNLTLYQLYDLIERFSLYMNWDIDIRSRLAGGKSDKKPDNWMKNIH